MWSKSYRINTKQTPKCPILKRKTHLSDLEIINDFISFLKTRGITTKEICQYLVTVSLRPFDICSIGFLEIQKNGKVKITSHFGVDPRDVEVWQEFSLDMHIPANVVLKNNKTVFINTLPDDCQGYELLNVLPMDPDLKTMIGIPVQGIRGASPVAATVYVSNKKIELTNEFELLLKTLSNLVIMRISNEYVKSNQLDLHQEIDEKISKLTNRQKTILELLSQKLTNNDIALKLGYSSSTIRQETIKIYDVLGIRGREDSYLILNQVKDEI